MTIHICFTTVVPKKMVVDILSGGHQIEMILTMELYFKDVCQQIYVMRYYLELKIMKTIVEKSRKSMKVATVAKVMVVFNVLFFLFNVVMYLM